MQSTAGEFFSRSSRLVKARQFQQVFKNSRRIQDDCITLLVSRIEADRPRLGFAVAKKQIRRAVDRNRIKRLVRESFRRNHHLLPDRDMIVMVRSSILKLDNRRIHDRLLKHWRKASQA